MAAWIDEFWQKPQLREVVFEIDGERFRYKESERVLVYDEKEGIHTAIYELDERDGLTVAYWMTPNGNYLENVTHWRRLPDPPGKKEAQ